MHVRVDDRRHHGLAGEIDARGAGGNRYALPGLDDLVAVDDERAVLDDAAIAEDQSCALERRDVGARRTGKQANGNGGCRRDCIHSAHETLPGEFG